MSVFSLCVHDCVCSFNDACSVSMVCVCVCVRMHSSSYCFVSDECCCLSVSYDDCIFIRSSIDDDSCVRNESINDDDDDNDDDNEFTCCVFVCIYIDIDSYSDCNRSFTLTPSR